MKKIISILTAIILLTAKSTVLALNSVQKAEAEIVLIYEDTVKISGNVENAEGRATLIVTGPDCSYETFRAAGDRTLLNYIDQGEILDGKFYFQFVMTGQAGKYEAAVLNEAGNTIYTDEFYFHVSEEINQYTTTRTAPWMINYHLTTQEQLQNRYKGGECGQMVWGLAIAPSDESRLLMGTDTSGIYKSTDGGKTWSAAGLGFTAHGVTDVAFYPDNADIAFAAASSHNNSWKSPYEGMWKSTDGGETWKQVLLCGFQGYKSEQIAFSDPDADGMRKIYAGAHSSLEIDGKSYLGGVYESCDLGETWHSIGLVDKEIYALHYQDGKLYAATNDYLFILADGNWTNMTSGFSEMQILSVAESQGVMYAVSPESLYKSTDFGENWSLLKTKEQLGVSGTFSFIVPFDGALGIMTNATSNNFFYSMDGGENFSRPEFDRINAFVKSNSGYYSEGAEVFSDGSIVIAMDGEIYKGALSNGVLKLSPSSSGISGFRAKQFLFDEKNPDHVLIAAVDKGLVTTVGNTVSHSYLPVDYSAMETAGIRYNGAKTVYGVARDPRNSERILISIGNWSNSILKESIDGGKSFTELAGSAGVQTTCLEFNTKNPDIIYAGNRVSYDNGTSWTELDKKIEAVSPFDPDKVYAVSSDERIYYSEDAARNWKPFSETYIYGCQRIHADIAIEDKLWAGTFSGGIKIITREGTTDANHGILPSAGGIVSVYDVAQNPHNPDHLVAGGYDGMRCSVSAGLFESLDGGASWRVVDGLTGSKDVWTVAFHPILPRVYIGTSSGTFVYEYEKYDDAKLLVTEKTAEWTENFSNCFTLWNFLENKLELQVFTALYTGSGALKDVETDKIVAYKNKPYSYELNNTFENASENDIIKQFIWQRQKPLTKADIYRK